jgi:competence/damage-inducible protein CinA-like protein
MLKVEMLSTGDEVLYGQIIDTNAAWLSDYLFEQGLPLSIRSTAGDDLASLAEILTLRSRFADILIVNGGLGPTKDDLSAEAAALALGVSLELRAEWVSRMEQWFAQRDRQMAESNLKQAMLPKGATLIDNPVGSACGFSIVLNDCLIFFTPGVPSEFKVMVQQQILPILSARFTLPTPPVCLRLTTFGRSESGLAQVLDKLELPAGISLGYRSASPIIELKLTGAAEYKDVMVAAWQQIKAVVGENMLYEGVSDLPREICARLKSQGLNVATLESFSAGLLSLQLNQAGAANKGGLYQVAVPTEMSELAALALETKRQFGSDILLAVGHRSQAHLDLALSLPQTTYAVRFHYSGAQFSVETQRHTAAMLTLDMLRRWLSGLDPVGQYEWLTAVEVKSLSN